MIQIKHHQKPYMLFINILIVAFKFNNKERFFSSGKNLKNEKMNLKKNKC